MHYAPWPLDYPNVIPRREATAFAAAGYDTVYVAGIGIRNPRLSSARKAVDRLARVARGDRGTPAGADLELRSAGVMVIPPRQVRPLRRLNARWMARQLQGIATPWADAVVWVWFPTPELVDALQRHRPAAVVYECYDALEFTPGMTGRWKGRMVEADHALARMADAVIATSQALADRYIAMGIPAQYMPPGVDPPSDDDVRRPRAGRPVTAGFVGTLDHRLDIACIRALARHQPDWRVRLIGPVQESFRPRALADLPNVSVEPPIAHDRVRATLAEFDVGLMPYVLDDLLSFGTPVKNLEMMAVGLPAVATRLAALRAHAGLLYFGDTPDEFAQAAVRALAEDGPQRVAARRAVAREGSWPRRHRAHLDLLDRLGAGPVIMA